jgi:cation diffusion facilitator family transporter
VSANAGAMLVKLATAVATGSSAVLAEAAHSAGDLAASIIALISVRAADRPPDPGHPFGHEKFEHVSSVVEGALIIVGALAVAVVAGSHVGAPVTHGAIGIAIMVGAAGLNIVVARRVRAVSRETGSVALEADAAHLWADVTTSLGAALALVLVAVTGIRELDAVVAFGIALLVARTGVQLVVGGTRVLVDVAIPAAEVEVIRAVLDGFDAGDVRGYHRLRARRAGHVRHVDLHLLVDPQMSVASAHAITDAIEEQLRDRLGGADVVIHVEPATHVPEDDARLL